MGATPGGGAQGEGHDHLLERVHHERRGVDDEAADVVEPLLPRRIDLHGPRRERVSSRFGRGGEQSYLPSRGICQLEGSSSKAAYLLHDAAPRAVERLHQLARVEVGLVVLEHRDERQIRRRRRRPQAAAAAAAAAAHAVGRVAHQRLELSSVDLLAELHLRATRDDLRDARAARPRAHLPRDLPHLDLRRLLQERRGR